MKRSELRQLIKQSIKELHERKNVSRGSNSFACCCGNVNTICSDFPEGKQSCEWCCRDLPIQSGFCGGSGMENVSYLDRKRS